MHPGRVIQYMVQENHDRTEDARTDEYDADEGMQSTQHNRNENVQSNERGRGENQRATEHDGDEEDPSNESPLDRDISTERTHAFDSDPPTNPADLHDLESDLESVTFPTTGRQIVDAVGEQRVLTKNASYTISELIPETDAETFDSTGAVRAEVQHPAVAAAMKQIVEASSTLPNQPFPHSQRKAYEETFRELRSMDVNDEDESITVLTNWVLEQIRHNNTLPGSRAVRQQAADMSRSDGYRIRNDEWLGI